MIGETVGVIRPTVTTDRYGDSIIVYPETPTFEIDGCAFDPGGANAVGGTSEVLDARTAVITNPTLYAPPGTDVEPTDRVVVRGRTFDVGGEPAVWRNPHDGTDRGVVVPLGEVVG